MDNIKKQPCNVLVATAASLLTDISSEMIVYLLPIFLMNVLKTSAPVIGLIEGVAETVTSLTKLVSGNLSDRLQNRKWFAVGGYALSTVAKGALALASGWLGIFGARLADRLGKGIRTAPRDALIAESVAPAQRGAAFGFHRAGDTFGAFLGIGLAMLIVYLSQQQAQILTRQTFASVVLISIIPAALAVILLALGLRETPRQPGKMKTAALTSLSLRQFSTQFKLFLGIVVLFTLGNSADSFIVLRAQERGASVLHTLAMVLTFNLVYTLAAQPLGALSDRIGRRKLIIAGWLVYGAAYLGFALANAAWEIWLIWAFYGLYYALTEGAIKALVADLVIADQRGTAYGWLNTAIGLVALPASLLAGILWQRVSPAAPFLFGAVAAGLAAVGMWWLTTDVIMPTEHPK